MRAALTALIAACLFCAWCSNASAYSRSGVYQDMGQLPRDWTSPYQLIDGVPLVHYGTFVARNPVTAAQYGLANYSLWIRYHDRRRLRIARHVANWLLFTQQRSGKWVYQFKELVPGSTQTLAPGWDSALAQGQAISLLERVYRVTHDQAYLTGITRALRPLNRSVAASGLDHWFHGRIIFEEYPTTRINFSFNGDLQTLIGLYDADDLVPLAHSLFERGVASVVRDLPVFNSGQGWSYYSIALPTHPPAGYDPAIHSELFILAQVTGQKAFSRYAAIWNAP